MLNLRRSVVGIVAVLLVATGCGRGGQQSDDEAVARALYQAESSSIAAGDLDAIATFDGLPARWNRNAAPVVRDYLDVNVPADRWAEEASTHIGELRAVAIEMELTVYLIQDQGIRKTLQDLTANYRAKLDALSALHFAVAQGDPEAEQSALLALSEASAAGKELGQALLDRGRPYIDPQVLADYLQTGAEELGERLKPE